MKNKKGEEEQFKMVRRKTLRKLEPAFGLGLTSIGANLLGSTLGSQLPPGTSNPLTSIGTSAAGFAGLAGTIALTGIALEETSKLNPVRKSKRNRNNRNEFPKLNVPNVQLVIDYHDKVEL